MTLAFLLPYSPQLKLTITFEFVHTQLDLHFC